MKIFSKVNRQWNGGQANAANLGIFKVRLDCHLLQTFGENLEDISVLWWTKNTYSSSAHMSHVYSFKSSLPLNVSEMSKLTLFIRDNFSIVWINLANEETDN